MKKIGGFTTLVVVMAAVILFSSLFAIEPAKAFGENPPKVLMIPREGHSQDLDLMIREEVGVMIKLLNGAGFAVDVATTSGSPVVGPTQKIENIVRLQGVNVNNYVGVIMPCMAVGLFPGPLVDPEAVAVVQKALSDGKPVAAALGSINILAEAGVLKGKKYSYFRDPLKTDARWALTDPRFADAIYIGPGTTQDGNIITCGVCPYTEKSYGWGLDAFDMENGPVKLTNALIAAMGTRFVEDRANIIGSWKIVSFDTEYQATGRREAILGKNPAGYSIYTPEGRMMSLLTHEGLKAATRDPDHWKLWKTVIVLSGTYRTEGDKIMSRIEASSISPWVGTERVSSFQVDGDQLAVTTPWTDAPLNPERGKMRTILTFERVK